MRIVRLDASPAAIDVLAGALVGVLDGGPAVLLLAEGAAVPAAEGVETERGGLFVATSGSTGQARLVALPAAALRASATGTAARGFALMRSG